MSRASISQEPFSRVDSAISTLYSSCLKTDCLRASQSSSLKVVVVVLVLVTFCKKKKLVDMPYTSTFNYRGRN